MDKKITQILQLVSIGVIASVFFGFLIVNSYLAIFGFWDYNFLKVQYVSAGTLFLILTLVPGSLFYIYLKVKKALKDYETKNRKLLKTIFVKVFTVILFGLVAFFSFFSFILAPSMSNIKVSGGFIFAMGIWWVLLVWGLVFVLAKYQQDFLVNNKKKELDFRYILWSFFEHGRLFYGLMAIPMLVLMFSLIVYPLVPRYLGGGKPVSVMISFNPEYERAGIGVENPFPAMLIYQSSDSVLTVTETGTYLFKQGDIAYIKYLEGNTQLKQLRLVSPALPEHEEIKDTN